MRNPKAKPARKSGAKSHNSRARARWKAKDIKPTEESENFEHVLRRLVIARDKLASHP